MIAPLPKHGTHYRHPEVLADCQICGAPHSARWYFYSATLSQRYACHDCFLIHRSVDREDYYDTQLITTTSETVEAVEAELAEQQPQVHDVSDMDVIIYEIEQGMFDDAGLDRLLAAVQRRYEQRARAIAVTLNSGARVRIVGAVRPAYMVGQVGEVCGMKGTMVLVRFDRTIGSIRMGHPIAVAPANIKPVEEKETAA